MLNVPPSTFFMLKVTPLTVKVRVLVLVCAGRWSAEMRRARRMVVCFIGLGLLLLFDWM